MIPLIAEVGNLYVGFMVNLDYFLNGKGVYIRSKLGVLLGYISNTGRDQSFGCKFAYDCLYNGK
jgi:hypothetical protein